MIWRGSQDCIYRAIMNSKNNPKSSGEVGQANTGCYLGTTKSRFFVWPTPQKIYYTLQIGSFPLSISGCNNPKKNKFEKHGLETHEMPVQFQLKPYNFPGNCGVFVWRNSPVKTPTVSAFGYIGATTQTMIQMVLVWFGSVISVVIVGWTIFFPNPLQIQQAMILCCHHLHATQRGCQKSFVIIHPQRFHKVGPYDCYGVVTQRNGRKRWNPWDEVSPKWSYFTLLLTPICSM